MIVLLIINLKFKLLEFKMFKHKKVVLLRPVSKHSQYKTLRLKRATRHYVKIGNGRNNHINEFGGVKYNDKS